VPRDLAYRRTVASYVAPGALTPRTRAALEGLGYRVVAVSTRGRFDDDSWDPDVRLVDERHLDRLPPEPYLPRVPIIQVARGASARPAADPRVVGSVSRPADLAELYPLLQHALEAHPRRAPRAPTQIPARLTRDDRRLLGAVTALSESGCRFRGRTGLAPGIAVNLLFPLPLGRMISTRARVLHRSDDGLGIAFERPSEPSRRAIRDYVATRLASLL